MAGPLEGIRIVEFEGIGPGPYCGMLLANLGADVVRIARPAVDRGPMLTRAGENPIDRGRRVVTLDLKDQGGREAALDLMARADGCVEGLRPGVMERLGLGPDDALARNPRLVYCRITGWGQEGPWSRMAGHDLNYIAVTGALAAMGSQDRPPQPPLNLVGDYGGGGLFAAFAMVSALLSAQRNGQGQVVDAAMVDGAASQMTMIYGLLNGGHWTLDREANLLDGGAPFYRCYRCADGRFLSVAAIEPQFFRALLEGLDLDPAEWDQADRKCWPEMAEAFADRIAAADRDHWAARFDGTDACVAPVLDMGEAPGHPHHVARAAFEGTPARPAPGPRFSATPGAAQETRRQSFEEVRVAWT